MINKIAPFHRCMECDEVITNPLCTDCLSKEMQIMIGEYDFELAKQIKGFNVEGSTTCIFCRNKMSLCAHCFSKDVYTFLREVNPCLAKEFLSRFDFDLRREFL